MVDIATIQILIKGDPSDLVNAANQAKSSISGMSSSVGTSISSMSAGVESTMKSIGSALTTAGAGMTAAFTAPIVAIAALAIKSADTVDTAFAQMAKSTGAQGAQLQALEASWKSVYASVPVDASTLTGVIDQLTEALHLQGPALTAASTAVIEYAKVSGTDAVAAAESFTKEVQAANAGLTAISAPLMTLPSLVDMFTVAFQQTGVSADTVSTAFDKTTASLSDMGMSIPQQIAMLTELTSAGIPARNLAAEIMKIPAAASKANETSTQFFDSLIQGAKDGKLTADQIAFLGTNLDNFVAAAKSGKLSNDALTASIANSAGATAKAYDSLQSFNEKLQLFQQQVTLALAPIGTTLLGVASTVLTALGPVLNFIGTLATAFSTLPAPVQAVIVVFGGLLAAVGPLLVFLGLVIGALAPFVAALISIVGFLAPVVLGVTTLGAAFGALSIGGITLGAAFAALSALLLPFVPIIIAIVAVIVAAVAIFAAFAAAVLIAYHYSETFRDIIGTLGGVLSDFVSHIGAAASALMSGNWSEAANQIKIAFTDAYNSLSKINWGAAAVQIAEDIYNGLKSDLGKVKDAWDTIKSAFDAWVSSVDWTSEGQKVGKAVADAIIAGVKGLLTMANLLDAALSPGGAGTSTTASSTMKTSGSSAAKSFVEGFTSGMKTELGKVDWNSVTDKLAKVLADIGKKVIIDIAIDIIGEDKIQAFKNDIATARAWIQAPFTFIANVGGDIISGLGTIKSGIAGIPHQVSVAASIIWTGATKIPGDLLDFINKLIPPHIVSITLSIIGQAILNGVKTVIDGLVGAPHTISVGISIIGQAVLNGLKTVIDAITGGVHTLSVGVSVVGQDALNGLKTVIDAITGAPHTLSVGISVIGQDALNGLKTVIDTIGSGVHTIGFDVSVVGQAALDTLKGILDWILSRFSVHEIGFALNMPQTNPLLAFQSTLKWIVENFSVHEIGFNINIMGMDKLNAAIDTWNGFKINVKEGPWGIGGQHIPGFNTPSPHIPGFNTPSPHIPGFNTPSPHIPGFNTPSPHIPGFNTPSPTIPGFHTPSATLPAFQVGPYGISVPGFHYDIPIPQIDLGPAGKWGGGSIPIGWDGTSLTTGSAGWGGYTLPSVGWGGYTVPSVGWGGYTVPSVGWGGYTVPSVGWGGYTVPSVGWGGYTVPSVGWGGYTIPQMSIPGFGINYQNPQIPHFGAGGYVDKETLAVVGETPEYIWPADKLNKAAGEIHHSKQSVYNINIQGIKMEDVVDELFKRLKVQDLMEMGYNG